MYKILVVEDSIDIQELLTFVLEPIAHVQNVGSVKTALEMMEAQKFDLVLMDVMLEDGNGFNLTRELRQRPFGKDIPIIFLTSKGTLADKALGFQLGAEDYIVKPFDPPEVKIRVESRLRKILSAKSSDTLEKFNLRLDIPLQKVFLIKENAELDVTPSQFKILFYLMTHENEVISREQLISAIRGKDTHTTRSIDTHVNSLRRKLDTYAPCIQAVYGSGYVFRGEGRASDSITK